MFTQNSFLCHMNSASAFQPCLNFKNASAWASKSIVGLRGSGEKRVDKATPLIGPRSVAETAGSLRMRNKYLFRASGDKFELATTS